MFSRVASLLPILECERPPDRRFEAMAARPELTEWASVTADADCARGRHMLR